MQRAGPARAGPLRHGLRSCGVFSDTATAVEKAISADGTRIAYWRLGQGPLLLLVHGALADHDTAWRDVIGELSGHFTTLAMDRRGRGGSGEPHPYSIEQGYEDIVAVIEAVGEDLHLVAHSYGANLALGAALRSQRIKRLVLYEPQPKSKRDLDYADTLDALLAAGDVAGFLAAFFRVPEERAARLRQSPNWDEWVTFAGATAADRRAFAGYVLEPELYKSIGVPTLFLTGEDSRDRIRATTDELAAVIPDSRIVTLPGQNHFAMNAAPAMFNAEVMRFLLDG